MSAAEEMEANLMCISRMARATHCSHQERECFKNKPTEFHKEVSN